MENKTDRLIGEKSLQELRAEITELKKQRKELLEKYIALQDPLREEYQKLSNKQKDVEKEFIDKFCKEANCTLTDPNVLMYSLPFTFVDDEVDSYLSSNRHKL